MTLENIAILLIWHWHPKSGDHEASRRIDRLAPAAVCSHLPIFIQVAYFFVSCWYIAKEGLRLA